MSIRKLRGDTLIEVLMALTIVGTSIAGGFLISHRITAQNRLTHEKIEALKLAEEQLELVRSVASQADTNPTRLTTFNASFEGCLLASSSELSAIKTSDNDQYYQYCQNQGTSNLFTKQLSFDGTTFKAQIKWKSALQSGGSVDQVVSLLYRSY